MVIKHKSSNAADEISEMDHLKQNNQTVLDSVC